MAEEVSNSKRGDGEEGNGTSYQMYDKAPWYFRVPFATPKVVKPPPCSLEQAPIIPETSASIFSQLTINWITPIITLGYGRPLQATDLWKMDPDREAAVFSRRIDESFQSRLQSAGEYNDKVKHGDIPPPLSKRLLWMVLPGPSLAERTEQWRENHSYIKPSLALALNDSVKWWFWTAGAYKIIGDLATFASPILIRAIIDYCKESYNSRGTSTSPSIGRGLGLVFGLLGLLLTTLIALNQNLYRATASGVYLRAGLIASIYARSLRLTTKSRRQHASKLITYVSTDVSRIDFASGVFHFAWAAPIQILLCLVVLLIYLGPSALAGFAVFLLAIPLQTVAMGKLFVIRKMSLIFTDQRVKLLQEILGAQKIVKLFAWEVPFLTRLDDSRRKEMGLIRMIVVIRAATISVAFSLPVVASVLSFVTYSLTGHELDPGIIFSSLALFHILRLPLTVIPIALGAITDASNAISRLQEFFLAEVNEESSNIDPDLEVAIQVQNGDFSWDEIEGESGEEKVEDARSSTEKGKQGTAREPFKLDDINLNIPKGKLTMIVGDTGSGKSSLLQAFIGDMKKNRGDITFAGPVTYCPQSGWIQSSTIRDNITFGKPFDAERYDSVINDAQLHEDLRAFPNGDLTVVGEKGVSLSGGQKQRINIARALYCSEDAIATLFDDCFSALDARVGECIFRNVFQKSLSGKARVLVTHSLHLLPSADYIITLANGKIAEQGTYQELIDANGEFARLAKFYGTDASDVKEKEHIENEEQKQRHPDGDVTKEIKELMQEEERNIGAVDWKDHSINLLVSIWASMLRLEFFRCVTTLLSPARTDDEQYTLLKSLSLFLMGGVLASICYYASVQLHESAIKRVMYAPMSFFDTTPVGRILNRFSKDVDVIDNTLGEAIRQLFLTASTVFGTAVLVSIILPWFMIVFACLLLLYYWVALYYRSSARELKRLESLAGISTIKAYGVQQRFTNENCEKIDIQNRAYHLTWANQRWLTTRLDFLGNLLVFAVALLSIGARHSISPSQVGVVLSYMLVVQQAFGWLVRQAAEVENESNAVERLLHYSQEVEQEAAHDCREDEQSQWPSQGSIDLENVVMSYRHGLPPALKGLTTKVRGGEHVGIVGRTGAGKSSIMVALYRLAELSSGKILIDGKDLSQIGLRKLRQSIAIIPQEPLLFSGTIRSNLDPFGLHDDGKLWDALRRAHLIDNMPKHQQSADESAEVLGKFTLDSVVQEEGTNLSVGQRSLVSLARALVKDAAIQILDEATASVDYQLDQKIQETVANEFKNKTLLCVAHRLRTVIGYHTIWVLDDGNIVESGPPLSLFRSKGVFWKMCLASSISEEDIVKASGQSPPRNNV
ncbi:hypothetical protein FRC02_005083 [Tulasnella sp. 418]|nr:hypothetical protein FRC02_005083 [Tulasnella sp. 418]